jgi:hypothetical protein
MQEFNQGGGPVSRVIDLSCKLGAQQYKHRPELLSLGFDHVFHDPVKQGDGAFNGRLESGLKNLQLAGDYFGGEIHESATNLRKFETIFRLCVNLQA